MKEKYLAIDIGGSKTRLAVFNDGVIYFEICIGGIGFATESEEDLPEYREALEKIKESNRIRAVAVNLGGKNVGQIKRITNAVFPDTPCEVYRESEGDAPLEFSAMHNGDVALLAGTGAIAVCGSLDNRCILGGWGANIGDGGSGYDIGIKAIRAALAALDGTKPLTPLQREITGHTLPFSTCRDPKELCELRDSVRKKLNYTDRKSVASLTKVVSKHAERGEADAKMIIDLAAHELGELVVSALDKLEEKKAYTVCVTGGLLNIESLWRGEFEKTVKQKYPNTNFVYEKDGIMQGTMKLAEKLGLCK